MDIGKAKCSICNEIRETLVFGDGAPIDFEPICLECLKDRIESCTKFGSYYFHCRFKECNNFVDLFVRYKNRSGYSVIIVFCEKCAKRLGVWDEN